MRKLQQAGDTIVEVIIVLAVLGTAISIAYSTASRSLQATRQAEENSQATQLVQSQIESLRSYSALPASNSNHIFVTPGAFCFDTSGNVAASPTLLLTTTSTGAYHGSCVYNNLFNIAIFYTKNNMFGHQTDTFTVRATWDDVQGSSKDTVTLVYRLHPTP